eukprot:TRINITY_DN38745_c0_g1_i1.p1 TRINITY_DN38745_c0_g1~~TRINITY_DN38745_c0_g1_i1.p1  ORF type:complete len:565 (-),score=125.63 TRINITY_DN38745_c0_g1_i1:105-1799(-)
MLLPGGLAANWVPFLTGTLHPRSSGLPAPQATGWRLMGVPPGRPLRAFVALSTTPPRLREGRELRECLESLLQQSATLEAVLLTVPRGPWRRGGGSDRYPAALPSWLRALRLRSSRRDRRQPRLRVLRGRDRGPGTGLLTAARHLRRDPTAWILAVDDDHVYHPHLLDNLLRFAAGTPGAAVAAHGWLALSQEELAASRAGPGLERSLRAWDLPAGPILCGFLGVLVQRAMLDGLEPPVSGGDCGDHNDIWISAHLARLRVRRALLADPLGARALATHKQRSGVAAPLPPEDSPASAASSDRLAAAAAATDGGVAARGRGGESLTSRRRRRPEAACVQEFFNRFGPALWAPEPRVVLCGVRLATWPQDVLDALLQPEGSFARHYGFSVAQASYTCAAGSVWSPGRSGTRARPRRLPCALAAAAAADEVLEHALLSEVLLAEREASSIVLLPPAEAAPLAAEAVVGAAEAVLTCAKNGAVAAKDVFCERGGWRAVSVAALACFSSEEKGMRQIYGCDGGSAAAGTDGHENRSVAVARRAAERRARSRSRQAAVDGNAHDGRRKRL